MNGPHVFKPAASPQAPAGGSFRSVEDIARWLDTLAKFEPPTSDPSPYAVAARTIRQLLGVVDTMESRLVSTAKRIAVVQGWKAIEEIYEVAKGDHPLGLAGAREPGDPSQLDLFDPPLAKFTWPAESAGPSRVVQRLLFQTSEDTGGIARGVPASDDGTRTPGAGTNT